jgi:pimeloyl-ACP methyl ester carboxylesterase
MAQPHSRPSVGSHPNRDCLPWLRTRAGVQSRHRAKPSTKSGDAAYLAALLGTISGPIVLVGHSYGGAVISNAAAGNEQVRALVFVDGWMPDEGESIQQLFEGGPVAGSRGVPRGVLRRRRPRDGHGDGGDPATMERRRVRHASGPPGWRSIPSWYLVGTEDRAIPPAGQRFMAERANATIEEVPASHASMVSQPEAVTRLILSAVEATSKDQ